MTREVKKKLEDAFYNYEKNMQDAATQTQVIDSGLVALYGGVKVQGKNGNGRETAIIKAIDKECELWRWCYVVEKTLEYFYIGGKDKFIRCRYFKRYDEKFTCQVCHISRSTYYYWLDDILMVALKWAKMYGVIGEENG